MGGLAPAHSSGSNGGGGSSGGSLRSTLSGRWESGEGWQPGYSALLHTPASRPVQEVRVNCSSPNDLLILKGAQLDHPHLPTCDVAAKIIFTMTVNW